MAAYTVDGYTLNNEHIVLRATVMPSLSKQIEINEEIEKQKKAKESLVVKKGKLWNKKPINIKPYPFYNIIKKNHKSSKLNSPLNDAGLEQKKIFDSYVRKKLIPVYIRGTSNLLPIGYIDNAPKVEWVAESSEKMDGILSLSETTDKGLFRTLSGNQIQTKLNISPNDPTGDFTGLYYQNGKSTDPARYAPTLFNAEKMRVDPDSIGHYQAWFLQEYVNPDMKLYDSNGKLYALDYNLAMRGLIGNIIDSKGYYRNDVVRKAIKDAFDKSALVYMPKGASRPIDISCSDQMVRACGLIVQNEVEIEVRTPDFVATFPFDEIHKFNEDVPKLIFKTEYEKKIEPLDSDTLLKIANQQMKMEAVAIQNLLEALYHQKWISYPRASITKAEAEPIRIRNPSTGKVYLKNQGKQAKKFVDSEFEGSMHEKQLLDLIAQSQIAYDEKRPYYMEGSWHLISGDLDLKSKRKNHVVLVDEPTEYLDNQIDIDVGERGIREEDLVSQLIEEDVATPSTRTAMLEELKMAGILNRRADKLIVDRRGYYLSALDSYYIDNNFERSYQLKNMLVDKSLEEMAGIVKSFDWIRKKPDELNKLKRYLRKTVKNLIEAEMDLAYLEAH